MACFYVTISENFKRFQYFETSEFKTLLKKIFWKAKTFFKKLEHCFLVESTKIKSASFLYKTVISEANVKTNKMVTTK